VLPVLVVHIYTVCRYSENIVVVDLTSKRTSTERQASSYSLSTLLGKCLISHHLHFQVQHDLLLELITQTFDLSLDTNTWEE